jgi:hypothetical protein
MFASLVFGTELLLTNTPFSFQSLRADLANWTRIIREIGAKAD